jgi:uncharacterized protein (DUF433 family)
VSVVPGVRRSSVVHCHLVSDKGRRARNKDEKTRQRSFRLPTRTLDQLDERAGELSASANALAQRILAEGLRAERHPLIYFRSGAAGRRPALIATRLDVWQVIEVLRANRNDIAEAAHVLGIAEARVRACIAYYADFKDEIDRWIEAEHDFAGRAEEAARRAEEALA